MPQTNDAPKTDDSGFEIEAEIAAIVQNQAEHNSSIGIPPEMLRQIDAAEMNPRPSEADVRQVEIERQILRSCRAIFKNALFVAKNVTGDPTYDPADVDFDDAIEGICQQIVARRRNRLAAERAASKARAA